MLTDKEVKQMKLVKILLTVFTGLLLVIGLPSCSMRPRQYTVSQLFKLLVTKEGEFNYKREEEFVNKEITVIGKISDPQIESALFPPSCFNFSLVSLENGIDTIVVSLPDELQKKIPITEKKAKVTGIYKGALIIEATSWEYIE